MKILTSEHFTVSSWSGGQTTQLLIHPEGSSLPERNFEWRISSAVVETEESEFTNFEGYERLLIPLKGKLEMEHQTPNGIMHQQVDEEELARFSGSWPTKGKGKLTDFNLIFKPHHHPKVHILNFPEGSEYTIGEEIALFYLFEGSIRAEGRLISSPALVLNNDHKLLLFTALTHSRLILIEMN